MATKSSLDAEVSSTVKSSESLDYEAEEDEEDGEVLFHYKELPEDYFDSLIEVDEWRDDGNSNSNSKMPAATKPKTAVAVSKKPVNVVKTKEPARETRAKERSKSPPKRKAKSPEKSSRTSPKRKRSKSPNQRKSKSPIKKSKSPPRRRSRSPVRRRSRSPRRRSPVRRLMDRRISPLRRPLPRKRSISPAIRISRAIASKRRSISPRKRSVSPGRRRSSRSPAKKRSRSPDLFSARMSSRRHQFRSTSHDRDSATSLSPEGSASRIKAPLRLSRLSRVYAPPVESKSRTRSPSSYAANQEVRTKNMQSNCNQ